MGKYTNEIEATGGLKQDKVVTVPITLPFADLEDLQTAINAAPSSVTAVVKRVTASSDSADVIITRTGPGVDEKSVLRLLNATGILYSVGRIKNRKAGDATPDED